MEEKHNIMNMLKQKPPYDELILQLSCELINGIVCIFSTLAMAIQYRSIRLDRTHLAPWCYKCLNVHMRMM